MKYLPFLLLLFLSELPVATTVDPIEEEVKKIIERIHTKNGNFIHGDAPEVHISDKKEMGASYNSDDHILTFEKELYQICQSFGSDSTAALAFIIGHELAHCYMEHESFSNFNQYDYKDVFNEEKNADIYGLFNAYLAGYNALDILPFVIKKIYKEYNLDQQISGYPPLKERLETAEEVAVKVEELINIFESATYLSAIGEYKLAALSYEYILKYYQGKEIYNNIGVNYTLAVLNSNRKPSPYLYPLELDWEIRINQPKVARGIIVLGPSEKQYLNIAAKRFEQAIEMDMTYLTAAINLSCVYILQGKYQEAINYTSAQEAYIAQNESAQLVIGIAMAHFFEETAVAIFDKLTNSEQEKIAYQANYNLKVLKEETYEKLDNTGCEEVRDVPTVDRVIVYDYQSIADPISLSDDYSLTIDTKSSSMVFQYYEARAPIFTFQKISKQVVPKLPRTIKQCNRIFTTDGYFIQGKDTKTIFRFSLDGQLQDWGKFY